MKPEVVKWPSGRVVKCKAPRLIFVDFDGDQDSFFRHTLINVI